MISFSVADVTSIFFHFPLRTRWYKFKIRARGCRGVPCGNVGEHRIAVLLMLVQAEPAFAPVRGGFDAFALTDVLAQQNGMIEFAHGAFDDGAKLGGLLCRRFWRSQGIDRMAGVGSCRNTPWDA